MVGFGKLVGGARSASNLGPDRIAPATVVASAPATVGSSQPDDGDYEASPGTSATPSTIPGTAGPDVVAVDFAKAWLNHHGISAASWHTGIAKYSTKALSDRMDGVDPGSVPADRMTGAATVSHTETAYVEVRVPTDQGILVLRLVVVNGKWLVDGVDWTQS